MDVVVIVLSAVLTLIGGVFGRVEVRVLFKRKRIRSLDGLLEILEILMKLQVQHSL